jgi:hypothetical protein
MQKIYFAFLFILSSCATRINYIGNKTTPTTHVDIYVSENAIKKPYEVMGRGFLDRGSFDRKYQETMQRKAIKKAKAIGADAVLFQDYAVLVPGNNINSVFRTDSIQHGVITTGNTNISPVMASGFNISFLKYLK